MVVAPQDERVRGCSASERGLRLRCSRDHGKLNISELFPSEFYRERPHGTSSGALRDSELGICPISGA
jgi:hypothetical protein